MDRVVSLMEINLEEDRFKVFPFDFMKNLMEDQDPIQDIPTLNERGLVRVGNLGC